VITGTNGGGVITTGTTVANGREIPTFGYFVVCTCPVDWNSVMPPSCWVHNPPVWAVTTVATDTATNLVISTKRGKRRKGVRRS
jgi:hypothetical protein